MNPVSIQKFKTMRNTSKLSRAGNYPCSLLLLVLAMLLMQSCYSVRLVNQNGSAESDPLNNEPGFYRGKLVHEIDTVLRMKKEDKMVLNLCETGGFHSVEYRVSFGMTLLRLFTFGRVKKIKVKITCLKQ